MRFQNHLDKFYPNSFTSKANDWVVYYSIELLNISSAIRFEKHIKKMKSRKFIENLKNSPELEADLKLKFSE
jgi:putative endonuclease